MGEGVSELVTFLKILAKPKTAVLVEYRTALQNMGRSVRVDGVGRGGGRQDKKGGKSGTGGGGNPHYCNA